MPDRQRRRRPELAMATALLSLVPSAASAQSILGRVVDQTNEAPVSLAGVFLMDDARGLVSSALADSLGRYAIVVPDSGQYYLRVQRLGYFEAETPLVAVSATRDYAVDFSLRPEPIRLDGIAVEVPMRRQNAWASDRLAFMPFREYRPSDHNPAAGSGFRLITGHRLEEAKLKSDDALDMLRWVYVPVYNTLAGMCPLISGPRASHRTGLKTTSARPDPTAEPASPWGCGKVYLDGRPLQPEHIETLPPGTIHAVMVLGGELHLITVSFEARFQAERGR